MLKWKVVTGDEKLRDDIARTKEAFYKWFDDYWSYRCSRERMLSPKSPLPHVYAKMCLPQEEVKRLYPCLAQETCSECGKTTGIWLETKLDFCGEYDCVMSLCPECVRKLSANISDLLAQIEED